MKRPPPISRFDENLLYDSCVNNTSTPSIYVIFERDQCYPEYLITYVHQQQQQIYDPYYQRRPQVYHVPYRKKDKLKPLTTPKLKVVPKETVAPKKRAAPAIPTPQPQPIPNPRPAAQSNYSNNEYHFSYAANPQRKKDCVIS